MQANSMPHFSHHFSRVRIFAGALLLTAAAALHAQAPYDPYARPVQADPPNRVARIAWAQGDVSLESAGTQSFGAAELNYPLSNGDRLYADLRAVSELQSSGLAVRLGNGADLTITELSDSVAQFALAQGSVRLRTRDLAAPPFPDGSPQQATVEVDTPNTTVNVIQPGDIRVDFYPMDGTTVVTVNSGLAEVSGNGFDQTISQNQAVRLSGFGAVYPEYVVILPPDELDQFDLSREQQRNNSISFRNHYVDPEMIGAADLDPYGDWMPTPQYGPMWFPRNVAYGWTPYSVGHWANVAPWGYTWVDAEPWGFAPFHYGRWTNFEGRWGWVPGPPPSVFRGPAWGGPPPRPVYSPALVAFVGGPGVSLSIGFGGGSGVTAWFPLGPSEPYVPWYHTSPAYVNRVNVTNVYNTNVTEIHNTYINKTTVYNITNVTYVNRTTATIAVNQKDFAAGHSTVQSPPVKLDANAQRQLTQAPVVQHPVPPPPPRAMAAAAVPARAVPANTARPVVQTKQGFQRAGAPPAATPLKAPTPPPASAASRANMPQARPVQTIAPPKNAAPAPAARPATAPAAAEPKPASPASVVRPSAAPIVQQKPAAVPAHPSAPVVPPAKPEVKPLPAPQPKPVIPAKPVPPLPVVHPVVPPVKKVTPPPTDDKMKGDKPKDDRPADEKLKDNPNR